MTAQTDPGQAPPPGSGSNADRRVFRRALKDISGCLVRGDDKADCIVLDLSLSGAKVQIDGGLYAEDGRFDLLLAEKLKIAAPVDLPVEVVWQRGSVVGLRFLRGPHEVVRALESLLPPECLVPEALPEK